MDCKSFDHVWEDWLGGQAPREFLEHLERCAACRNQASELVQTRNWLAQLRQEPPLPGPAFWTRLEGADRAGDFWEALNWVAARAALALALLVLLIAAGVLLERDAATVTQFDTPQTYLEEGNGVAVANGQLNRDQVVLTLVAYQEPQR